MAQAFQRWHLNGGLASDAVWLQALRVAVFRFVSQCGVSQGFVESFGRPSTARFQRIPVLEQVGSARASAGLREAASAEAGPARLQTR